jgi:hypothetical protein
MGWDGGGGLYFGLMELHCCRRGLERAGMVRRVVGLCEGSGDGVCGMGMGGGEVRGVWWTLVGGGGFVLVDLAHGSAFGLCCRCPRPRLLLPLALHIAMPSKLERFLAMEWSLDDR